MSAVILLSMGAAVVVPALATIWAVRRLAKAGRLPSWAIAACIPVGAAVGLYVAFFVVFDDVGRSYLARSSAPSITMRLPQGLRGSVYVFFDPAEPAFPQPSARAYSIEVPASGRALVGSFPGADERFPHARFQFSYPDGSRVPLARMATGSGSFGDVRYQRFFVGTEEEQAEDAALRERNGTSFDEESVYALLKRTPPEASRSYPSKR